MDFVQSGFKEMIHTAEKTFEHQFGKFSTKIDDTFDLDKKTSMIARLQKNIDDLFDPKKGTVTKQLDESFKKIFDEKNKESVLSRLQAQLEDYFGDKEGKVKKIIDKTRNTILLGGGSRTRNSQRTTRTPTQNHNNQRT